MPPNPCEDTGFFVLAFSGGLGLTWTDEEMQTICQVYADLAAAMEPTSETVLIRIVKTNGLDPGVLGVGTPIWDYSDCGIAHTTLQDALQGGDFPQDFAHGHLYIRNLGTSGDNWHTLSEDNGTPPILSANEHDLYSIALHETLHILGFSTGISPSGAPSDEAYSQWDNYLYKMDNAGTLIPLLVPGTSTACCNPHDFNSAQLSPMPDVLTGTCDTKVVFSLDGNTVLAPVNETSANVGEMQGRLSHLQIDCKSNVGVNNTEQYVMHPILAPQQTRRLLTNTEKTILCRLGYPMLNAGDCFDVVCVTSVVDDTYSIILSQNANLSIPATALLTNDDYIDPVMVEYIPGCGYFLDPAGQTGLSVTFDGSNFNVTAALPGIYSFCYAVFCGSYCEMGTVSVEVASVPFPIDCNQTCNLTPYGDMEAFPTGWETYTNTINDYSLQFGGPVHAATSDVFAENDINQLAHIITHHPFAAPFIPYVEYLSLPLCRAVPAGCTLTIQFDACATRGANAGTDANAGYLSFFAIDGIVGGCSIGGFNLNGVFASTFPWNFVQCPVGANFPLCDATVYHMTDNMPGCGVLLESEIAEFAAPVPPFGIPPLVPSPFPAMETYTVQWTNTTGVDIEQLMIVPTGTLGYNAFTDQEHYYIDNIIVESSCRPIVDISAEPSYDCTNNVSTINYTVCLNAESPATSVIIDLTPEITSPLIGIPIVPGGDFAPNGTAQVTLVPGQCTNLTLNFHVPCSVTPNTIIPVQLIASVPPQGGPLAECVEVNSENAFVDFEFEGCCGVGECLGTNGNPFLWFDANGNVLPTGIIGTTNDFHTNSDETWQPNSHPFGSVAGTAADPIRINGDLHIDHNIVIERNASLVNLHIEFGPKGRIIVNPGKSLTLKGVRLTGDPICKTMWQGIRVIGPGTSGTGTKGLLVSIPVTPISIENSIENAIVGVATMQTPLFDLDNIVTTTLPGISDPFSSIASTALPGLWQPICGATAGGHLKLRRLQFIDCFQGVNVSWRSDGEYIRNCHFESTGDQWYPYMYFEAGINGLFAQSIADIIGCTFENLKYGVRANAIDKLYVHGNGFNDCQIGVSSRHFSYWDTHETQILENKFNRFRVGIQADANEMALIRNNNFNDDATLTDFAGLVGIYLRGCSFDARKNTINHTQYGAVITDNDIDGSIFGGNTISNATYALVAEGDNTGVEVTCNQFIDYASRGIDIRKYAITNEVGNLGEQGNCFAGEPAGNTFLPAPGSTDLYFGDRTAWLYYDDVVSEDLTKGYGTISVGDCVCEDCNNPNGGIVQYCANQGFENIEVIDLITDEVRKNRKLSAWLYKYVSDKDYAAAYALVHNYLSSMSERRLVQQNIKEGNYIAAQEKLNTMTDDTEERYRYKQYQQLLLNIGQDGRTVLNLQANEMDELQEIAASRTKTSFKAQGLLYALNGTEFLVDMIEGADGYNWHTAFKANNAQTKEGEKVSGFYPNPSAGTTSFDYALDKDEPAKLLICDQTGKVVETSILQGTGTYSTQAHLYQTGLYVYHLTVPSGTIATGKFVVVK